MLQKIINFFKNSDSQDSCGQNPHPKNGETKKPSKNIPEVDLRLAHSERETLKNLDEKIIIGKVESLNPHKNPKMTRVRVAQVAVGNGKTEQILCGGVNLEDQDIVAVALVGAKLSADFEIGERDIRGEKSRGMICSRTELGLNQGEDPDHGIWKLPHSLETKIGIKLKDL